ncbi:endonuclease domain-containing protein [Microbacterium sp. VKM Ac-2923]|uniref:endonuclease domain-containing protein n=1 Tax=Microbacterium sp. VKM Ac-2923 TaxID=2929476 RepID=UPI001FB2EF7B|nr:DUF559 domain-containing protein [Microbacterium sp. VKM Ac-2923]MCJ1707508.1 endonuclease domain-containing protein [Microbacterium sp. VKM Ac-2923]
MDADLTRAVATRAAELGGVVRATRLVSEGHTRYRISRAVDRGLVVRVRLNWIAVPSADPHLVAAARTGTMLSCVTAAERRGLWVAERPERPHVAYPGRGRLEQTSAVVHWQRAIVPRHPDQLEDDIENILMTVAGCQPYESALAIWESALNKRLVDLDALRRLRWTGTARRLVEDVTPWSDSGLETFVPLRLRWMRLPIRAQIWIAGYRVDFLIGERLALQIDGGHHVGAQRTEDIRHDVELMLRGFHVIRVGYEQVVHRWPEVQAQIMRAVAQGLHRP